MLLARKLSSNKLLKSSIFYTVGGFLLQGINFLTFPIFSRLLTPGDYGIANLFTVWVGMIVTFGSVQLNSSLPIAKVKFNEEKYKNLQSSILSFTTITFSTLTLLSAILSKRLVTIIGLNSNLIVLLTVQSFFSFINLLYGTILIQDKKDKKYLGLSIVSTMLNIFISLLLVMFMKDNKYLGKILGGFIASLLVGGILYFKISKGKFILCKESLSFALKLAVPIVPHVLSQQLLTNSDRIMLNNFQGSTAVGIYSFAYNIGMIISLVFGSINNAWVPWLFENLKAGNKEKINTTSRQYIIIFSLITISVVFISPEIAYIMATKEYMQGSSLIPLIALSYYFVFLYSFAANIEFYFEKTRFIPIGTVLAALVNISLNFIFIPKYGIIAAGMTTLVSYILLFIFHLLVVIYVIKYDDNNVGYYFMFAGFVIIFIIIFYAIKGFIILRYLILLVIATYGYAKRKVIFESVRSS